MSNMQNQLVQGIITAQNMIINPPMNGNFNQTIQMGEQRLKHFSQNPQFLNALMQIVMSNEEMYMKQAMLVLMKNYVEEFWVHQTRIIHPNIKNAIRNNILKLLHTTHTKVVTAVCGVVSNIAQYDFPKDWPNLLQILVERFTQLIKTPNMGNIACGYVKCIRFVSEHFSEKDTGVLMPMIRMLIPYAGNKNFPDPLRAHCVRIVKNVLTTLYKATEDNGLEKMARKLFNNYKTPLINFMNVFIKSISTERKRFGCRFKIEVYKLLQEFVIDFSEYLSNEEKVSLVQSQFLSLKGEFTYFERTHILTNQADEIYDEESNTICTKTMLMQALDCMQATISNYQYFEVFQPHHIRNLVDVTFEYFQLDQTLITMWRENPNDFVDVTDDTSDALNIRKLAQLLLQEIVEMYDEAGLKLVVEVFQRKWALSFQMFQQDKSSRWGFKREAALYGIECVMKDIDGPQLAQMMGINIGEILNSLRQIDLNPNAPSFLQAQAVIFIGETLGHQNSQQALQLFHLIFPKLTNPKTPFPLRIAAARTLTKYISDREELKFPPHVLNPILPQILSGLCNLLQDSEVSTLYITLECIKTAARANPHVIGDQLGKKVCDFLFVQFQKYHMEVYDTYEILGTITAFSKNKKLMDYMLQSIFPRIVNVLQNFTKQGVDYLAKMLELLTILIGGVTVTKEDTIQIINRSFVQMMNVSTFCIQQAKNHQGFDFEVIENCTSYFKAICEGAPQYVFNQKVGWSNMNNCPILQIILNGFIQNMLNIPEERDIDRCWLELGRLISTIVQHYGKFLLNNNVLQSLFKKLLQHLNKTKNTPLMQSICMVFVRIFARGEVELTINILKFLISVDIPLIRSEIKSTGNPPNGLTLVMFIWTFHNNFFQGYLERRFSCLALDHLLSNLNHFGKVLNPLKVPYQLASLLVEKDRHKNPEAYMQSRIDQHSGHRFQNHNYELRRKGLQGMKLIPFPPRAFVLMVEMLEYEIRIVKKKKANENVMIQYLMKNIKMDLGKKKGLSSNNNDNDFLVIQAMLPEEGSEDDDDFYDRFEKSSEVYKLDLIAFLSHTIKKLARMNNQYVNAAMGCLAPTSKRLLQSLLNYNGPTNFGGGSGSISQQQNQQRSGNNNNGGF